MLYFNDSGDKSLNRFFFVSVILHALLFITYPQWSFLLEGDAVGFERGGVIQVIPVADSPAREISPVMDRASQQVIPRVEEPRPTPEPPREEAAAQVVVEEAEPEMPRPEPQPEPEPLRAPEPEPEPIPEPEVVREPEPVSDPDPVPDPEPEQVPEPTESEVLTSEQGVPVNIEETARPESRPEPAPRPEPEASDSDQTEPGGPTGSGESDLAFDDDAEQAVEESGTGEADTAPPPPPPPPSGRSVHSSGDRPLYPKDAEHEGVEGTVVLQIIVSLEGETQQVLVLESSGDSRLDEHARRTVESGWRFEGAQYDYAVTLSVSFELGSDAAQYEFGDVEWLLDQSS